MPTTKFRESSRYRDSSSAFDLEAPLFQRTAPQSPQAPAPASSWPDGPIGKRNVVAGWVFICMGAISGSIIGAWSFGGPFPTPPGFENYGDLGRRMVRLAHVAMFMLPVINILIGKELDGIALPDRWKQITSKLAIFAMLGIPFGLVLGGVIHPWLWYLSAPAATALLCALVLMAVGKVRTLAPPG